MALGPVVLEKTWGRRFGVRRSGGMYRIAHRELMQRLTELQQAADKAECELVDRAERRDGSLPAMVPHRNVTLGVRLSESDRTNPAATRRE
jgi:hypothetical protein